MSSDRRKLPIGIQTFAKIRSEDYYYVDKTPMAWRLAQEGGYYFLSRPRRFGKSLFLDTLKELFESNEPLFRGLYIHDRWDWATAYPVIRLSFGGGVLRSGPNWMRKSAKCWTTSNSVFRSNAPIPVCRAGFPN